MASQSHQINNSSLKLYILALKINFDEVLGLIIILTKHTSPWLH